MKWSEVKSPSRVRLFATLWTVACQAPLSMEFCRQEYWSGLPFPSPGEKWSKESNKENRGEMTESMIPTQFAFITCSSWCESGFCPSLPGTVCSGANVPRPSKGSSPALLTSWMVMRSKSTVPGKWWCTPWPALSLQVSSTGWRY